MKRLSRRELCPDKDQVAETGAAAEDDRVVGVIVLGRADAAAIVARPALPAA